MRTFFVRLGGLIANALKSILGGLTSQGIELP